MNQPMTPEYLELSLRSLRLRPGIDLQAKGIGKGALNYQTQFLGVIEGKCLMIVPVGLASLKFGMQSGEKYEIYGFTGQHDFHFTSTVLNAFDYTFKSPAYAYAVLTYPETVTARKVRKAIRIQTDLPALAKPHGSTEPVPVTVVDVSVDGALVHSASPLGAVGDLVRLDISVDPQSVSPPLLTLARICHNKVDAATGQFLVGLLFESLSTGNRMALKDFVLSNLD